MEIFARFLLAGIAGIVGIAVCCLLSLPGLVGFLRLLRLLGLLSLLGLLGLLALLEGGLEQRNLTRSMLWRDRDRWISILIMVLSQCQRCSWATRRTHSMPSHL